MIAVPELSDELADVLTGIDVGWDHARWCAAVVSTVAEADALHKNHLADWVQAWRQGELGVGADIESGWLDALHDLVTEADGRYEHVVVPRMLEELRDAGDELAGRWDRYTAQAADWRRRGCVAELAPWDGTDESWPGFREAAERASLRWRTSAWMADLLGGGYDSLARHGLVAPARDLS